MHHVHHLVDRHARCSTIDIINFTVSEIFWNILDPATLYAHACMSVQGGALFHALHHAMCEKVNLQQASCQVMQATCQDHAAANVMQEAKCKSIKTLSKVVVKLACNILNF